MVDAPDFSEESFGVLLLMDDNSREYICNLSLDSLAVEKLVEEFNSSDIEACHINSVIEDFKYNLTNK
jgi:hypothetical protein